MPTTTELLDLLSRVQLDEDADCTDVRMELQNLLQQDSSGAVLKFLDAQMPKLEGKRKGGIAYVLADYYFRQGRLPSLQRLMDSDEVDVKVSVLNALWGEPNSSAEMGAGIVEIALDATRHSSPEVRTAACFVIQNQCGWKVDVSGAVKPLQVMLSDASDRVRSQVACAIGNLAKCKYELSAHVALLGHNLRRDDISVRNYSAWALWQLSRAKHDLGLAVADLTHALTYDDEWNDPRKNAIGALLHHAQKSQDNRVQVQECLKSVKLDPKLKAIQRFQEKLSGKS